MRNAKLGNRKPVLRTRRMGNLLAHADGSMECLESPSGKVYADLVGATLCGRPNVDDSGKDSGQPHRIAPTIL